MDRVVIDKGKSNNPNGRITFFHGGKKLELNSDANMEKIVKHILYFEDCFMAQENSKEQEKISLENKAENLKIQSRIRTAIIKDNQETKKVNLTNPFKVGP